MKQLSTPAQWGETHLTLLGVTNVSYINSDDCNTRLWPSIEDSELCCTSLENSRPTLSQVSAILHKDDTDKPSLYIWSVVGMNNK